MRQSGASKKTNTVLDAPRRYYSPARGSAPGVDGEPYEVYYYGIRYVSALLGQALHSAQMYPSLLPVVLGVAIDLLVWIFKFPGADTAAGMRPLQLPPCFRRLFGAYLAGAMGPDVESALSEHQAATAGGQCGPNIRSVFRHLDSTGEQAHDPTRLYYEVLGHAAAAVERLVERIDETGCQQLPAVLFADQSMAFERMGWAWLRLVFLGWGFPAWLVNSLLALIVGRVVRAMYNGNPGPLRQLMRSLGMGGTSSPISWAMGTTPS